MRTSSSAVAPAEAVAELLVPLDVRLEVAHLLLVLRAAHAEDRLLDLDRALAVARLPVFRSRSSSSSHLASLAVPPPLVCVDLSAFSSFARAVSRFAACAAARSSSSSSSSSTAAPSERSRGAASSAEAPSERYAADGPASSGRARFGGGAGGGGMVECFRAPDHAVHHLALVLHLPQRLHRVEVVPVALLLLAALLVLLLDEVELGAVGLDAQVEDAAVEQARLDDGHVITVFIHSEPHLVVPELDLLAEPLVASSSPPSSPPRRAGRATRGPPHAYAREHCHPARRRRVVDRATLCTDGHRCDISPVCTREFCSWRGRKARRASRRPSQSVSARWSLPTPVHRRAPCRADSASRLRAHRAVGSGTPSGRPDRRRPRR